MWEWVRHLSFLRLPPRHRDETSDRLREKPTIDMISFLLYSNAKMIQSEESRDGTGEPSHAGLGWGGDKTVVIALHHIPSP